MKLLPVAVWTLLALIIDIGTAVPQQEGRIYRIGYLFVGAPGLVVEQAAEKWTGQIATFRDALRDGGYVVGKNLVMFSIICDKTTSPSSLRSTSRTWDC